MTTQEVSPLMKKILQSGLVDRHMAVLLETWKNLPEGAVELVNESALKDATRRQLEDLAEEIGDEVAKAHTLKESMLDLERIRWPVSVDLCRYYEHHKGMEAVRSNISGVVDSMGRYYFRIQDVEESWFIPGMYIYVRVARPKETEMVFETILEVQPLYLGDRKICIQVSTFPVSQWRK